MNEIYLISTDEYKDSLLLDNYCVNEKEIFEFVLKEFKELYLYSTKIIVIVDLDKLEVQVNYYDEWDVKNEFLETKIYYLRKLKRYV